MARLRAQGNSDRIQLAILRELREMNGKDPDPNSDDDNGKKSKSKSDNEVGVQEPVEQPSTRGKKASAKKS